MRILDFYNSHFKIQNLKLINADLQKSIGLTVTRFIKIFSIVIISLILLLVIIGILAPATTYFTKTQIIKSPISVVWRKLTDVQNYPTWQSSVTKVVLKDGSSLKAGNTLQFFMSEYEAGIFHEVLITKIEDDKTLAFARKGNRGSPLLKEYQTSYSLKRLLDGTTEISVSISYRSMGFITKIYNQMFLRGKIGSRAEKDLDMLKDSIEKM